MPEIVKAASSWSPIAGLIGILVNSVAVVSLVTFIYFADQSRSAASMDRLSNQISQLAERVQSQTTALAVVQQSTGSFDRKYDELTARLDRRDQDSQRWRDEDNARMNLIENDIATLKAVRIDVPRGK